MISWLRRHRQPIFIATILIFAIGIFVGLGGHYFTGADYAEAVASVGGTKIPYMRFKVRVNQYLEAMREERRSKGGEVADEEVRRIHTEMLRDMIVDEILASQAERLGLRVTDLELAASIRNTPRFQRNGAFDQALYFQIVRLALRTTPEDYEAQTRRQMLSFKLKQLVFNAAKLSPAEARREYARAKGSEKHFDKEGDQFAAQLHQSRAVDLINFYLKQATAGMEIRTFLEQREQGL